MLDHEAPDSRDSTVLVVTLIACVVLLAAVWWIYQPGVGGPLLLDDWANLSQLENAPVVDWNSFRSFVFGNTSGPTGRPIAMLSFLGDGQSWPIDVAQFKRGNIVTHLMCALGLSCLSVCLLRAVGISRSRAYLLGMLCASLWALHPLNVSTVLYVIQRMTQLATLFSLLSLSCYTIGRMLIVRDVGKGLAWLMLALFPFGVLAVLSKENGVLLLLCFLLLEATLFTRLESCAAYRRWFRYAVIAPFGLVVLYLLLTFTSSIEAYDYRSFSLIERLLTESRVLADYLANIFLPQVVGFGLYHDDLVISTSLWQPLSTSVALGAIAVLFVLAVRLRLSQPMFSFAIFWYFAWHFLESTYIPLELYFEHRNYLPMMGPILAALYYLSRAVDLIQLRFAPQLFVGVAVAWVLFLGSLTLQLTRLWGDTGALISHWAQQHPRSIRAQSDLVTLLASVGAAEQGIARLSSLVPHYQNDVSLRLKLFNYGCSNGLDSGESLGQIAAIEGAEISRVDINVELRELVDNLRLSTCAYPSQTAMLELMNGIDALQMSARGRAIFAILYSELLVHYDLIDDALARLDQAFSAEPSVDIAIRQSTLAGSVGRFDEALAMLERAYTADEQRRLMLPSREKEIDEWRLRIEALL